VRLQECHKYLTLQQWTQFRFLYPLLAAFEVTRARSSAIYSHDLDFPTAWTNLRFTAVNSILKNLENCRKFEDFMDWMVRLSEIVTDPESLWAILHTEVRASLKVTAAQSDELAAHFFKPDMVFEYGLASFLECSLCDFSAATNQDALIDMFYCCVGFIKTCRLPAKYEITATEFHDFVVQILIQFSELDDFEADRFVWLVESMREQFPISKELFKVMCEKVLSHLASRKVTSDSLGYLAKLLIISTSPTFQSFPVLTESLNAVFKMALEAEEGFVHNLVLGSFVSLSWNEKQATNSLSDPVRVWRLYLSRLVTRLLPLKSLAERITSVVIEYSVNFFVGYYGFVQPSKARAADLRRDIFALVDSAGKSHTAKMSKNLMKNLWYLLYLVAVSGAPDGALGQAAGKDCAEKEQIYLGLAHSETDFADYPDALARLGKKFEAEAAAFPKMVEYVRANY
jgi:hypothetical protein